MTGALEGPLIPTNSFSNSPSTPPAAAPSQSRFPLSPQSTNSALSNEVVDIQLELGAHRISAEMGTRLLMSYVELLLYLKGQVPFPPSQLRRMAAGGRKGSPHQNKLLKALSALSADLPSTLSSCGSSSAITVAIVFGLGREKCFIQLSGTEFEPSKDAEEVAEPTSQSPKKENVKALETVSNENLKFNTVPSKRRSPRPPLQEISSVDTLSTQLSSVSLRPSADEAMIRQAERALSQAMACSDVDFNDGLAPMGAQVFLRAPRRFKHASWAVRPEAARMLDAPFKALTESDVVLIESVRVRAKDAPVVVEETEEMIWWGWDGRLAGYA
ncbi:hypothetical protein RSOLAG22IIIB_09055 [Rhizoctonia solani]|uniref:Uncharacterized protein n=1 Tax=Rhizoctonia solani TaxID=456999 RepID=A0A0K6FX86_9AGAM|nr:hypothetical protein RSOLAG22IIIB_09055 [Rhizoctonia solani]